MRLCSLINRMIQVLKYPISVALRQLNFDIESHCSSLFPSPNLHIHASTHPLLSDPVEELETRDHVNLFVRTENHLGSYTTHPLIHLSIYPFIRSSAHQLTHPSLIISSPSTTNENHSKQIKGFSLKFPQKNIEATNIMYSVDVIYD